MPNFIRRFLAALTVALIAVTGVAVAASPAQAVQSDCPSARLCTWNNINYGGTMWTWNINTISQQTNGCQNMTASARNVFSSLWANVGIVGTTVVRVWSDPGCTGFYQRVYSNTADPNLLQDAPVAFIHDDIESISVRS